MTPSPGKLVMVVASVLPEGLLHCGGQLRGGLARGVELLEQRKGVLSHGVLDRCGLRSPGLTKHGSESFGFRVDPALTASCLER